MVSNRVILSFKNKAVFINNSVVSREGIILDIVASLMAAVNADMLGAILLVVIGVVIGIIIGKVISNASMGGGI
jgi:hypothetical protein